MAEYDPHEMEARIDRLESQMETVLSHLENLNGIITPGIGTPGKADITPPPVLEPSRKLVEEVPPIPAAGPIPVFSEPQRTEQPLTSESWTSGEKPFAPQWPRSEPRWTAPSPKPAIDWEQIVGRQWALWVGAVAVFLSVAFFLAYAWTHLSASGRLATGAIAGVALLLSAEYARKRTEHGFSEVLCGAGLAIFYLDAWASCARYNVVDYNLALVMMIIITIAGVAMAVRYDSKGLHGMATLGGFATPALLPGSNGGGGVTPFLTYITVLNAGVLAVAVLRKWRENVILSGLATAALLIGWSQTASVLPNAWTAFAFITVNFLMYGAALVLPAVIREESTEPTEWLTLLAATAFYFAVGYWLINDRLGSVPGLFPVALAAAFVGLGLYLRKKTPDDIPMQTVCTGIICTLFVLAVPIQLRQGWVSVGWSVEAVVLITLAGISGSEIVRRAGQVVWCLAALTLLGVLVSTPLRGEALGNNAHAIPVLAFILASLMAAQIHRTREDELRPLYAAAWVGTAAFFIGEQTHIAFKRQILSLPQSWAGGQPLIISALLAVWAVTAYAINVKVKDEAARLASIGVAGISIAAMLSSSAGETGLWHPLWNPRFLAVIVNILSLAGIAWMGANEKEIVEGSESGIVRVVAPVIHLLVVFAVLTETYIAFQFAATPFWEPKALMTGATFVCCYAALMLLPACHPERAETRWLAWILAGCGILMLLSISMANDFSCAPLWNVRFLDFSLATIATAAVAGLSFSSVTNEEEALPHIAMTVCALVALWGLTQETWGTFQFYQASIGEHWQRWAQSAVSVVWTAAGSGLLLFGVYRGKRLVRLAALGLIGITVCKVFLFDLGYLESQYKVLSFGGLGVALIGISWLYSHFSKDEETTVH